jgi:RNA polymerase sigma-70 factor (ECF subfamily)
MPAVDAPAAETEDTELVARCQRGDARAFDELVTKYRQRIFAMIYHMVHNEQDAWDLAQESFFKAWKSIARFRGQSSFYTWLYRIVMNVTIDALRKRHIQGGTEFDDQIALQHVEPGSSTLPAAHPLPAQKLEQAEIRARIDAAIARLSPDHRAVILMREIEDMQYSEIAEALECSIGTVMSRLFYARRKLQGMLKDLYENL